MPPPILRIPEFPAEILLLSEMLQYQLFHGLVVKASRCRDTFFFLVRLFPLLKDFAIQTIFLSPLVFYL